MADLPSGAWLVADGGSNPTRVTRGVASSVYKILSDFHPRGFINQATTLAASDLRREISLIREPLLCCGANTISDRLRRWRPISWRLRRVRAWLRSQGQLTCPIWSDLNSSTTRLRTSCRPREANVRFGPSRLVRCGAAFCLLCGAVLTFHMLAEGERSGSLTGRHQSISVGGAANVEEACIRRPMRKPILIAPLM